MVLQSIRENEPRTRAIGYPVERYKIVSVMLSGLFAGLAGVLYAVQNEFAAPDFVYFLTSGDTVIYNVMGGIGTLVGPIVGAGFFQLARNCWRILRRSVPLSDPARPRLHRDDHFPAAGHARLCATVAQSVGSRRAAPAARAKSRQCGACAASRARRFCPPYDVDPATVSCSRFS